MLQAQSLSCRRGRQTVFRDVSFSLKAGDVLLVTGTNGSGKSSLLRVLAGLLPVSAGSLLWEGRLNYVGHLDAVKPELTVAETLDYWRALYGVENFSGADPFGVRMLSDRPVRVLSAGQKRRLALSRLLFNDAPLWLLDEPTTGLDQKGQDILGDCLDRHRAKGGIAVIATHQDIGIADAIYLRMRGECR